jgi:hypothetical protein
MISETLDRIDGTRVLKLVKRMEGYAGRLKTPLKPMERLHLWFAIALGVGDGDLDIEFLESMDAKGLTSAVAHHMMRVS